MSEKTCDDLPSLRIFVETCVDAVHTMLGSQNETSSFCVPQNEVQWLNFLGILGVFVSQNVSVKNRVFLTITMPGRTNLSELMSGFRAVDFRETITWMYCIAAVRKPCGVVHNATGLAVGSEFFWWHGVRVKN